MTPISGVNTGAVRPSSAAEKTQGAPKVQSPRKDRRPLKPAVDEYVPEEEREPSGLYWMGKDEDGKPQIFFDDPERAASGAEKPEGAEGPEPKGPQKGGKKAERWMGNTDKVDREIERLKKKQKELNQRIHTETDEARIQDLERQLAQVERELKVKDNDTYRKQHATFTQLS